MQEDWPTTIASQGLPGRAERSQRYIHYVLRLRQAGRQRALPNLSLECTALQSHPADSCCDCFVFPNGFCCCQSSRWICQFLKWMMFKTSAWGWWFEVLMMSVQHRRKISHTSTRAGSLGTQWMDFSNVYSLSDAHVLQCLNAHRVHICTQACWNSQTHTHIQKHTNMHIHKSTLMAQSSIIYDLQVIICFSHYMAIRSGSTCVINLTFVNRPGPFMNRRK